MKTPFEEAGTGQINQALINSTEAFKIFRQKSFKERADFLRAIAKEMEGHEKRLIAMAVSETNLHEPRLKLEFKRTIFQLRSYADACEKGAWMDIRIDTVTDQTSNSKLQTTRADLRKTMIPLGPVVVFGASNFPFAYSTAGGDTACAFAAGCSVVLKGHPAHAGTSQMVADMINAAAKTMDLPENIFIHLQGASFDVGKNLVQHPLTKAVGFTGSFEGGKSLFDLAAQRSVPIPVFAEMGSVNPVFILPEKLRQDVNSIASMYAASITQSVGQFCTNPGVLIGIESDDLNAFEDLLGKEIAKTKPEKMLHQGIAKNFLEKRKNILEENGVTVSAVSNDSPDEDESLPTLAKVQAKIFLQNPLLHKEVFGPFSLLVKCHDVNEMLLVAQAMEGQLTASLVATDGEVKTHGLLVEALKDICGRLILNGVPTGVEVALAMHHGGPFPATTDSRFTAVGSDGIKRFARPVCFQSWSNELLPQELKNENPLGLWRTVNHQLTNEPILINKS